MRKVLTSLLLIGLLTTAAPAAVTFNWQVFATSTNLGGTLYDTYDLEVTVGTNLTAIQMYLEADSPAAGDFYQDLGTPGSTYDTHVSIPSPMVDSGLVGAAFNLQATPLERAATFTDQLLDIAWGPEGSPASGAGTFTVARVSVSQDAMYGTWFVYANETGSLPIPGFTATGIGPVFPVILGDANHDKSVSGGDFTTVQGFYGDIGAPGILGDANQDGSVSGGDFTTIQGFYGNTYPPEPSEPIAAPEPTTVVLLAFGALCLAGRARRK